MSSTNKFDVALSFAGEQRDFVYQVASILEDEGIAVFYDEFYKSHLWGKDLSEYFKDVYYSNSDWCIMFVSKDYVSKAWPSFERKNAIAKEIRIQNGHLLPVRFDDSEVPGLPENTGYLDARKESPETIAKLFLEKMEQ